MMPFNMPAVMGILNVTPDSFYDGGKYRTVDLALSRVEDMLRDGADIIDIGGESTRPGAPSVSAEEEIARVAEVIEALSIKTKAFISVDTMKTEVASVALRLGAKMINDVFALRSPGMIEAVAEYDAYAVICHMKGEPGSMQQNTEYEDLLAEVTEFLFDRAEAARRGGVKKDKIILDPGIGFGKSLEDNYRILYNIDRFKSLGYPVLIGLSRKSLIGRLYDKDEDRLPATIGLNAVAVNRGADIIRVHDVREHSLMIKAISMLNKVSGQ